MRSQGKTLSIIGISKTILEADSLLVIVSTSIVKPDDSCHDRWRTRPFELALLFGRSGRPRTSKGVEPSFRGLKALHFFLPAARTKETAGKELYNSGHSSIYKRRIGI